MNKNVSVVLPNYNGQHLLKKFLPSVLANLKSDDEVIVVDDASTDNSVKWLTKTFKLKPTQRYLDMRHVSSAYQPDLSTLQFNLLSNKITVNKKKIKFILVALEVNERFGASSNVGFAFAANPLVFLLNTDVKLTKGVTKQLRTHFEDDNVFGVGCLEYERNLNGNTSGKNKLWFDKGLFMHSKADDMTTGDTAWVSGGSGMFSREKWMRLNGFSKVFYPAYWEDVDISFRARQSGYKVLFDQEAVVFHIHESTNNDVFGQDKIDRMSWDKIQKFTLKNGTFIQKLQYYIFKPYWIRKRKIYEAQKLAM